MHTSIPGYVSLQRESLRTHRIGSSTTGSLKQEVFRSSRLSAKLRHTAGKHLRVVCVWDAAAARPGLIHPTNNGMAFLTRVSPFSCAANNRRARAPFDRRTAGEINNFDFMIYFSRERRKRHQHIGRRGLRDLCDREKDVSAMPNDIQTNLHRIYLQPSVLDIHADVRSVCVVGRKYKIYTYV